VKKILIINTGGTFNKIYNPITGDLDIDKEGKALKDISKHWLKDFEILNIIGKDSLDMSQDDRDEISKTIKVLNYKNIIIVHGTDTIDKTAKYLAHEKLDAKLVLTGAMVPFYINPIEATANFASAYGYLQQLNEDGVYIVLNGSLDLYDKVKKNRKEGRFEVTMVYKNKF
jgi:L-asparaginase